MKARRKPEHGESNAGGHGNGRRLRKLGLLISGRIWGELAEMELFPTELEAARAKKRVLFQLIGRWVWICVVFVAILISLVSTVLLRRFIGGLGLGISQLSINLVLMFLTSTVCSVIAVWMLNRHVSKHLRKELIKCGVPVCFGCGYHLKGTPGTVCPECGRVIDEKVAKLIVEKDCEACGSGTEIE